MLTNNAIADNEYNFDVFGNTLSDFMNSIDTSNLVNGKPIYYIMNQSNSMISPEDYPSIGYLAIVNCLNMTVEGLTFTNNLDGIMVAFANDSTITNNNVTQNYDGIYLYSSSNNIVSGNTATANDYGGIRLESSSNNTVVGNTADANNYGIYLDQSSNNFVNGNTASENYASQSGPIFIFMPNGGGIYLFSSSNNTLTENYVTHNSYYGITIYSSSNDTIYHNTFENTVQILVDSSSFNNTWDNGPPSGGNYWSDYNGTDLYSGTYQNMTGSDGIGDAPYTPTANNTDHYPLMGTNYKFYPTFFSNNTVSIIVISNSTVSNLTYTIWLSSPHDGFQPGQPQIGFITTGQNGTTAFCRVMMPKNILWNSSTYSILRRLTTCERN